MDHASALLVVLQMWSFWVAVISLSGTQAQEYISEIRGPGFDFSTSFLRAEGDLAGEVEIVDQNIVRISQNSANYVEQLGDGLNTVVAAMVQDLNVTLAMEIVTIIREIDDANEELARLERAEAYETDPCDVYFGCETCTEDPDCVWCASSSQCLLGDQNGPFGFLCADYDYMTCAMVGCTRIKDCGGCVFTPGCGWCSDSQQCMAGGVGDSGDCEPTLWLAGPRATCPGSSTIGVPEAVRAGTSSRTANHVNSAEITDLIARISDLEQELETLRVAQSQLGEDSNTVFAMDINVDPVNSRVLFLGDIVDETQQSNEERDLSEARDRGSDAVGQLNTAEVVSQSMQDRAIDEDRALRPLASNTNSAARRIRENYDTILDLMRANEARLRREVNEENRAARNETEESTTAVPADSSANT